MPGIHPGGPNPAREVGFLCLEQFHEGRQIGRIILSVPVHHGGIGACGGQKSGVEGGTLAKVLRETNRADLLFAGQKGGGAILAAVIHRNDFGLWHGLSRLGKNSADILLLVVKRDDEGEFGRHGLSGMEQRGESGK